MPSLSPKWDGKGGLEPATMVLREPTLDDVFLELTGRTTVDGDEGGDE